ncbi:MAG TPA: helix-turn-helix transcriptional regulator [Anaeromyxobacteraceae bacterium]|nr:helix-turn-helix transcriptional regulator [Anaeromyxobacteraceae bacterium]
MTPDPDAVAAFGRHLLRERELRGLAREEVVRRTKLPPAVVEAIESGDAGRMPPRAYLIGYLRTYAAAVGLDPDELVLRWQESEGGAATTQEAPRRRRLAWVAAAGAVLAMLAAALLWLQWRARPAPPDRARRAAERAPTQQPDAPPEPGR